MAQFWDDFNTSSIRLDPRAEDGWAFFTGDGQATIDFCQGDGYASILVDASQDRRNIWWALIRRCVSGKLDLSLIPKENYEFRIEARIRVSRAPRRVNLHLNTQRTTDYHSHLMEFDIPDTTYWHTISMTTGNFDARPGDRVYGQLALMDWGLKKYRVEVDYFRVDIVNIDTISPDLGVPVPYHPPVPEPETFSYHLAVAQDAVIDLEYPDLNFNNWCTSTEGDTIHLLSVSGTQLIIMRWDLTALAEKQVAGSGLLELTTYEVQRALDYQKDFGMVRVVEILGGDPDWEQTEVSCNSFCRDQSLDEVLNSQMIIDVRVQEKRGRRNYITISNPVLQRMVDGRTLGLAIRPLGAVSASFYAREYQGGKYQARLHFDIESKTDDIHELNSR